MSAKNPKFIKKFGGGIMFAKEIADAVAGGKATDTESWIEFGFLDGTTINDTTEVEDIKDETGNVVDSDEVERKVKISGLLMQTDKDTLDFFRKTVRNKYYMVYYNAGEVGGKIQEYFFGICTIKPQIEVKAGTKRVPFEISVLNNVSSIPFGGANVNLPSGTKATTGTIPAGDHYLIVETTE